MGLELFDPKSFHCSKFVVAQVGVCLVVKLGKDGALHGISSDVERHTPVADVFACFCALLAECLQSGDVGTKGQGFLNLVAASSLLVIVALQYSCARWASMEFGIWLAKPINSFLSSLMYISSEQNRTT